MFRAMKALPILFFISLFLASCGGGGGSSSSSSSGVATDNTKATGTFRYVLFHGYSTSESPSMSVEIGTATFDGAGGVTRQVISPGNESDSFSYTAKVDNSITFSDFVGTIRSNGNFIVLSSTSSGSEMILFMVKNSGTATDTARTYHTVQFLNTSTTGSVYESSAMMIESDWASPSTGNLRWRMLSGLQNISGTNNYTFANTSGIFMIHTTTNAFFAMDEEYGSLSPDDEIMIAGDAIINKDDYVLGAVGLEAPGIAMSAADLSGTFIVHQYMDEDVSVGDFTTTRTSVTFDGYSIATYSTLASSTGSSDTGSIKYTVAADGSLDLEGQAGYMLEDGSVFTFGDYTGSSVNIQVGIKK